jgi:hypothetical protein
MIQAPTASAAPAPKPVDFVDVRIPDGSAIEVTLNADVSSEGVQEGTIVAMTVVKDVVVNGLIVVRQGSEARARVITITEPGRMGRLGEVSWAMQDVTAVNGDRIPIDFTSAQAGASPEGGVDGAIAPTWEFRKNKPTVMAARRNFQAVVHGNVLLKLSAALAKTLTASVLDAQPSGTPAANNQPESQVSARTTVPPSTKP